MVSSSSVEKIRDCPSNLCDVLFVGEGEKRSSQILLNSPTKKYIKKSTSDNLVDKLLSGYQSNTLPALPAFR
jgi:hypothetical protein